MKPSVIRSKPCSACPYRRDVPSGVWAVSEYLKLPPFDKPTAEQPMATFQCHSTPEFCCNGWAIVHTSRGHEFDQLALRVRPPVHGIPDPVVPLFSSGREAAEHGLADVNQPGEAAGAAIEKLTKIQRRRS